MMMKMQREKSAIAAALVAMLAFVLIGWFVVLAQETKQDTTKKSTKQDATKDQAKMKNGTTAHVMVMPDELNWSGGPSSLPAGAEMAVLKGDPTKSGLFTIRLKMPGDYKIPPHSHPVDEHVTVIEGTFHMGMGERLDPEHGKALKEGGFAVMPAKMNHYAWTDGETIIQLHAMGPFVINYVNSADDPRKKTNSDGN